MNDRIIAIHRTKHHLLQHLVALEQQEHELQKAAERTDEENVDFSKFKDTTRRLLVEFWDAPNRMLSHEDIREDVMLDKDADDRALRQVICKARKEMAAKNFAYDIENIRGTGYRLIRRETLPNVSEPPRNTGNLLEKIGHVR